MEIRINGNLDTTLHLDAMALQSRKVILPTIATDEGDTVTVSYLVYVKGLLVASGSDSYDPTQESATIPSLNMDSTTIGRLLKEIQDSLAVNGSSSSAEQSSSGTELPTSSSAASDVGYFIAFTTASSTAFEDASPGDASYPSVSMTVIGPENGALPSDREVSISLGGSAKLSDDFTVTKLTVMIPANTKVGQVIKFSITPVQDNLVEGTETITAEIDDPIGVSPALAFHTLNLVDADSAWVQFAKGADTVSEENGSHAISIELRTNHSGVTLARPATLSIVVDPSSTALSGTQYESFAAQGNLSFDEKSKAGDSKAFSIIPKNIPGWNANSTLQVSLAISDGPLQQGIEIHPIVFKNTDYENIAVLVNVGTSATKIVFISPDLDSVNEYAIQDPYQGDYVASSIMSSLDSKRVYPFRTGMSVTYNTLGAWVLGYHYDGNPNGIWSHLGICPDSTAFLLKWQNNSYSAEIHSLAASGSIDLSYLTSAISLTHEPLFLSPCIGDVGGGLVLDNGGNLQSVTYVQVAASYLAARTMLTGLSKPSGLTRIVNPNIPQSGLAYVLDGTSLISSEIFGLGSPTNIALNSNASLGSGFSGGWGIVSTPRNTIVIFASDSIYEVNPTTGARIRAKKHSLGKISDLVYIQNSTEIPTP